MKRCGDAVQESAFYQVPLSNYDICSKKKKRKKEKKKEGKKNISRNTEAEGAKKYKNSQYIIIWEKINSYGIKIIS